MEIEKAKYQASFQQRRAETRQKAAEEKRQKAQELSNLAVERNNAITAAGKAERKDFFGRLVSSTTFQVEGAAAPSSPTKYSKYSAHSVFFKYQEGHTNAVRRTVQVQDFL